MDEVEYAGQTGYAMSQYLRFYEEEAWSGEVVENVEAEVVNGSALWLRREPSTSGATITMMYQGERMRVLEKGETWTKVEYAGLTGYAMTQYLRFTRSGSRKSRKSRKNPNSRRRRRW